VTLLALDTSVAVPLLVRSHRGHADVVRWRAGRDVVLSGPALIETYSVLTRLPGDARLAPDDAAHLLALRFGHPVDLDSRTRARLPRIMADLGIAGGAAYDAMIALAAARANARLATRDVRAFSTYQTVGASVELVS
jgi:predicted nucleic acid-binding protein